MAITGTWKMNSVITDAYTGALRWGTGINPIHSVVDAGKNPTTAKQTLRDTTPGDAVDQSIVETTDWGYCAGDYTGGVDNLPGDSRRPPGHR